MSGHTSSPCISASSPTFAMTVRSTRSPSSANPCASFVPPVPPARTVTRIGLFDQPGLDLRHESLHRLGVVRRREARNEVAEADAEERPEDLDDLVHGPDELVLPGLGVAVVREDSVRHAPRLVRVVADDAHADAGGALDLRLVPSDLLAVAAQDLVLALHVLEAAPQVAGVGVFRDGPQ